MRPHTDHAQPQKRRRFENGAPSSQGQSFYNGNSHPSLHHPSAAGLNFGAGYNANDPFPSTSHRAQFGQTPVPADPFAPMTPSGQPSDSNEPRATQDMRQNAMRNANAAIAPFHRNGTLSRQAAMNKPPDQRIPLGGGLSSGGHRRNVFLPPSAVGTNDNQQTGAVFPNLFNDDGTSKGVDALRRASYPPFSTGVTTNNPTFPNVLPPLAFPGQPQPNLGAMDTFAQQFATMEPAFRSTAMPTAPPAVPQSFETRESPTQLGSGPQANAQHSNRTPHHVSSNVPNGSSASRHTVTRATRTPLQKTSFSSSRGRSNGTTGTTNSSDGSMSIRMIRPVKEALDLFRDESPIMVALAQTVVQSGTLGMPHSVRRDRILSFTGFAPSSTPACQWLLSLSKNDLDILAWVFVVSKHGRKEEVARRIVSSLRSPLRYREPPQAKKPGIPTRIERRGGVAGSISTSNRHNVHHNTSIRPRGNMPSLAPASSPGLNNRGHSILSSLQRQIGAPGNVNEASAMQPVHRLTSQQSRNKQMHSLCVEILQGYRFDVGENPFNIPMNPPLGVDQYVIFSSVQLSRGTDPVLKFPTPPPIDAKSRPEVKKGDIQVHLRCLRIEVEKPRSEWKQAWPFPAACRVNGHSVTLSQAQRYTNGKLAGRDAATNVTPFLRKYKAVGSSELNKVTLRRQVSTATPASGQYVFLAQEVLILSREAMTKSVFENSEKYWIERRATLERKGTITPSTSKYEMAQQGVMQFLTDPDGLTVSSMKVSLRCPLALTRISTPVKGRRCQHVQCFDLENFLEYSRRSSKFDCPVCNKSTASPSMLVVSPYIEHALEKYKDCDEVEIFQDGSMVPVERKQSGVASDDDEDSGMKDDSQGGGSQQHGSSGKGAAEVVDLTLDSDDETPAATSNQHSNHHSSPLPGLSGSGVQDQVHANGPEPMEPPPTGALGQPTGSDVQQLEQDIGFSFRADIYNWGDPPQVGDEIGSGGLRIATSQPGSQAREAFACDVIAIDSD